MIEPTALVLVLTEDSETAGARTIGAIFKGMIRCADDACETHLLRLTALTGRGELDLDDATTLVEEDAHGERETLGANRWRGEPAPRQEDIRRLCQRIATRLLEPKGFVVFHFDGDVKWSERPGYNEAEFERVIWARVDALLRERLSPRAARRSPVRPTIAQPELSSRTRCEALQRLLVLIPHYSIEAWLYQNTARAAELCRQRHGGEHVGNLEAWRGRRKELDELMFPKDTMCLKARHNLDLAKDAFPVNDVYGLSPSYTASVDQISNCRPLIEALKPDYSKQAPQPE